MEAQPRLKEEKHLPQAGVNNAILQLLTESPSEGCLWILFDFPFAPVEFLPGVFPPAGEAETPRWLFAVWFMVEHIAPEAAKHADICLAPVRSSQSGLPRFLPGSPLPTLATGEPFIRVDNRQSALGKEKPPGYLRQREFAGYPGD